MINYIDLCDDILENGFDRKNERTGVSTRSVFGRHLRFDLREEFPIVKAKFTAFKTLTTELLWFLRGDTNIQYLKDNNCRIWNEWADEKGELGPVYGKQWRRLTQYRVLSNSTFAEFNGAQPKIKIRYLTEKYEIDQIANAIHLLKTDPSNRRIMVNAYNVGEIQDMALAPCHYNFQFFVNNKNELSCLWNQRSVDTFLGLPFNIASYALLTHMIAQVCGLKVGELIASLGDTHIYENHFDAVREMVSRELITEKATLVLNPEIKNIDYFTLEDIKLENYVYHPSIKAPIAV